MCLSWHPFRDVDTLTPFLDMYDPSVRQLPRSVVARSVNLQQQVRHLGLALPGRGGVGGFINKALTPPGVTALDNALTLLTRIGAFRTDESLTPLVSLAVAMLAAVFPPVFFCLSCRLWGKAADFGCGVLVRKLVSWDLKFYRVCGWFFFLRISPIL